MFKISVVALLSGVLALYAHPSHADQFKVKATALLPQDAATLRGKSVAVTLHPPNFLTFWEQIGGNGDWFLSYRVPDPAVIARVQLASTLHDEFGANVRPMDEHPAISAKPADLIALHRDADYVLSVRHTGGIVAPAPGGSMVGNFLEMQLVETAAGRVVSKARCNASTYKHPSSPSLDTLLENRAQLIKDILLSLSWRCTRQFAIQGLGLAESRAPVIPPESIDPLAKLPITTIMGARRAAREQRAANVDEKAGQNAPPQD